MNAYRRVDTPATLIERATDVLARIQRVAPKAGPESRLRLMGELALTATVLEHIEFTVFHAARGVLAPAHQQQLPKRRKALPPFRGGRISKARRTA